MQRRHDGEGFIRLIHRHRLLRFSEIVPLPAGPARFRLTFSHPAELSGE